MRREAVIYRSPNEKFERIAELEAMNALRHPTKVRYERGKWTARCKCLWKGPERDTAAQAERDAEAHG